MAFEHLHSSIVDGRAQNQTSAGINKTWKTLAALQKKHRLYIHGQEYGSKGLCVWAESELWLHIFLGPLDVYVQIHSHFVCNYGSGVCLLIRGAQDFRRIIDLHHATHCVSSCYFEWCKDDVGTLDGNSVIVSLHTPESGCCIVAK